jgi:hypothetical protein
MVEVFCFRSNYNKIKTLWRGAWTTEFAVKNLTYMTSLNRFQISIITLLLNDLHIILTKTIQKRFLSFAQMKKVWRGRVPNCQIAFELIFWPKIGDHKTRIILRGFGPLGLWNRVLGFLLHFSPFFRYWAKNQITEFWSEIFSIQRFNHH